jgi:diadenosine tetraphosphate (Ap4A) HIT family hydrolase
MIVRINSANFLPRIEQGKGIEHHLVLRGRLDSRAAVAELRDSLLPDFMAQAGIKALTKTGLRIAVDILPNEPPVVQLMAGDNVPAQNPQDWLSASVCWDPTAPAIFFERCTEAARAGLEKMAFGNRMLYAGEQREVFGVVDGDPKLETHFLVLASSVFGNIMDQGFTSAQLNQFFETAFVLCRQLGILNQPIRYVANTGTGFQVGPRVHLHVLSDRRGLPSMFPSDYGFSVGAGGTIISPTESSAHLDIVDLIGQRQQIKGFSPEAKTARQELDARLLDKLESISPLTRG